MHAIYKIKFHILKRLPSNFFAICLFVLSIGMSSQIFCSHYQNFEKNLHYDRLHFLKDKGFEPKVIYDIGAYRGFWSLQIKEVFPQAKFYLFEANENNRIFLQLTHLPFYFAVLGNKEQLVTFYTNDSTGDSLFREQTKYYQGSNSKKKEVQMTTLANVVQKNQIPSPDLIKFDVQGAEKLIIQGSPHTVMNAEVVILETKILEYNEKAPLIFETMSLMDSLGYSLLDILECHYLPTGELNEIDFLFVKKDSKLIKKGILIE